jgi:hypothetical protein
MAQEKLVGDDQGTLEPEALEHRPDLLGRPTPDPHDPRKRNAGCYHTRLLVTFIKVHSRACVRMQRSVLE